MARNLRREIPYLTILLVAILTMTFLLVNTRQLAQDNRKAVRLFCALMEKQAVELRRSNTPDSKRAVRVFLRRNPEFRGLVRQARKDDSATLKLMRRENLDC